MQMEETRLASDVIFRIAGWPITNSIIASWVSMLILVVFAFAATRKKSLIPKGIQNIGEMVVEQLLNLVQGVTGDRRRAIMFLPIILTLFLFIAVNNWMQLIPGFGALGFHSNGHFIPLLRGANSDLNITLSLALITVGLTQFFGVRENGVYGWIRHYFHNPMEGGIALIILGMFIGVFVGALEVVSEFVKIVSLSFRLFGNIYAGEILLSTIGGLSPFILPVPFMMLEVIVGVVQAAVFSLLTLVFFSIITTPIEHGDH